MSTIRLYRLSGKKYARDLSGEGSRLYGGRWNHVGTPCVYAAENRSLAVLEYSVNSDLYLIPRALSMLTLLVPAESVKECTIPELPGNWMEAPAPFHTKDFGTRILQQRTHLLIRIPSAIVPQEFNYLINPQHPLAAQIQIAEAVDFIYDPRVKQ